MPFTVTINNDADIAALMSSEDAQSAIDERNEVLAQIFEEGGPVPDPAKVKVVDVKDGHELATQVVQRNDEITKIGKRRDELQKIENIAREVESRRNAPAGADPRNFAPPVRGNGEGRATVRNLRSILSESVDLKNYRASGSRGKLSLAFDLSDAEWEPIKNNTIALTDINVPATRLPGVLRSAQNDVTVADLMLQGSTDGNSIQYLEETTFTNAAVEVAEGAAKPESALDFTLRTEPVEVIATWLKATRQALDDVPFLESYIRERMGFMVRRREEGQLLVGDGTTPNISGILDRSGIQTQAKGADDTLTAIYKAITLIRANAFDEPSAGVFHPLDWQDIATLKTADGVFIWGNPWDGGPERVWGLPLRITAAMTQNTGLVGAFRPHAQIFRRQGVTIDIATEHASDFISNLVTIRAEERLALAVYRPAAFATITGI